MALFTPTGKNSSAIQVNKRLLNAELAHQDLAHAHAQHSYSYNFNRSPRRKLTASAKPTIEV